MLVEGIPETTLRFHNLLGLKELNWKLLCSRLWFITGRGYRLILAKRRSPAWTLGKNQAWGLLLTSPRESECINSQHWDVIACSEYCQPGSSSELLCPEFLSTALTLQSIRGLSSWWLRAPTINHIIDLAQRPLPLGWHSRSLEINYQKAKAGLLFG